MIDQPRIATCRRGWSIIMKSMNAGTPASVALPDRSSREMIRSTRIPTVEYSCAVKNRGLNGPGFAASAAPAWSCACRASTSVQTSAAAAALVWTDARGAAGARPRRRRASGKGGAAFKPKFFTAHEYATVGVLVDLIIPQDERSGSATDAGVPAFMDFMMIDQPRRQVAMRGGLAMIDRLSRRGSASGSSAAPIASVARCSTRSRTRRTPIAA